MPSVVLPWLKYVPAYQLQPHLLRQQPLPLAARTSSDVAILSSESALRSQQLSGVTQPSPRIMVIGTSIIRVVEYSVMIVDVVATAAAVPQPQPLRQPQPHPHELDVPKRLLRKLPFVDI